MPRSAGFGKASVIVLPSIKVAISWAWSSIPGIFAETGVCWKSCKDAAVDPISTILSLKVWFFRWNSQFLG